MVSRSLKKGLQKGTTLLLNGRAKTGNNKAKEVKMLSKCFPPVFGEKPGNTLHLV